MHRRWDGPGACLVTRAVVSDPPGQRLLERSRDGYPARPAACSNRVTSSRRNRGRESGALRLGFAGTAAYADGGVPGDCRVHRLPQCGEFVEQRGQIITIDAAPRPARWS